MAQGSVPGGGVKLEGEDGVISVAYLANEATLHAQVTVKHVVGGIVQQCDQVGCILVICYLQKQNTRMVNTSGTANTH